MSSALQTHRRQSWRGQQKSQQGSRWFGRIVSTLFAILLIVLFVVWLFWGTAKPQLQVFLLHTESYDLETIVPPMFASTAAKEIKDQLGAVEQKGKAETILNFIEGDSKFAERLADTDDTVMVIVRGYVLTDEEGNPVIACSNLGVDQLALDGERPADSLAKLSGVIRLKELITRLCRDDSFPKSYEGSRIVVLDLEPLAIAPRLGQFGDDVFSAIDDLLKRQQGSHSENVWVLATRGPLQNPGWDHQSKLPLSTRTLLDALAGQADFDGDRTVDLSEVCDYLGACYRHISQGSSQDSPQVILFRGAHGKVGRLEDANGAWVANVRSAQSPEDQESENGEVKNPSDADAVEATPVALIQSADSLGEPDSEALQNDEDATSATGESQSPSSTTDDVPSPTADLESEDQKQVVTFWDVRDRFESSGDPAGHNQLNPITVAPQVWRRLLQTALHADLLAFDPSSPESQRDSTVESLAESLRSIEKVVAETGYGRIANDLSSSDLNATPLQLYQTWRDEVRRRVGWQQSDRVAAADRLQLAIALGQIRLFSEDQYRHQTLIVGGAAWVEDTELKQSIDDGIDVLVNQSQQKTTDPDLQRMMLAARRIDAALRSSNNRISVRINSVLEDFGRSQAGNSWDPMRNAYAILRSTLPTGPQRRALQQSIASSKMIAPTIESLDRLRAMVTTSELHPKEEIYNKISRMKSRWKDRYVEVVDMFSQDDLRFASQLRVALDLDPLDSPRGKAVNPTIHSLIPKPEDRVLSVKLFDRQRKSIRSEMQLEAMDGRLDLEVSPDSNQETEFDVSYQIEGSGSEFGNPAIALNWVASAFCRPFGAGDSAKLIVGARKRGTAELVIKASRFADDRISTVPITVMVKAKNPGADAELKKLNQSFRINVRLAKRDQVQVAVKTVGLSRREISGEDSLPRGVWLRTFAWRKTRFEPLELFNEAGRKTRARVWLIALKHPFFEEGISEYWPDVLATKISRVREQVVGANGKVLAGVLGGYQVLKGPVDVTIGSKREPTPLAWVASPADGDSPDAPSNSAPAAGAGSTPDNRDVSHGMALVVRLIDDEGRDLPGDDQLIWLIPKPWAPESYVDLADVYYENGQVHVSAALAAELDGDSKPDQIAEIEKTAVEVHWTENNQWARFQPSFSTDPIRLPLKLVFGRPEKPTISTDVVPQQETTKVQLDVDGWPRALVRTIQQREGATAKKEDRFDQLFFSAVEIQYGKDGPERGKWDLPMGPTKFFWPDPDQVFVFPGKATSLVTRLAAEITPSFYRFPQPPEIVVKEAGGETYRFWTDRSVTTLATEIKDKGDFELYTTVEDLQVNWDTKAAQPDAELSITARLTLPDGKPHTTSLKIELDSTRPKVQLFRVSPAFARVKQRVDYVLNGFDKSGITQWAIGKDLDGDNAPDLEGPNRLEKTPQQNLAKSIPATAANVGRHRIGAQVWDRAGLASVPVVRNIEIAPIQKATPKPAPKKEEPKKGPDMAKEKPPEPKKPKKGPLEGVIDTGALLRGKLTLSPVPKDIRPEDGVLEISKSRPTFSFSNVPEGSYSLSFEGYKQGTTWSKSWEGLNIGKRHKLSAK